MTQSRHPASTPATAPPRSYLPPPALWGFLVLLVLVFAVSYGVGRSVGPVAPGMHGPATTGGGTGTGDEGGTDDMDMGGGHGH
ncbi:hypothetical protein ACFVHR_05605 [Streptomyces sp. NPDC127168]|uniref:hypothetical protein n=1 Tax=unclassified Streptomyces TaxID=2593676 RepID=UPI0033ED213F